MDGHEMDEEPVAHSSPKPELERRSRNFLGARRPICTQGAGQSQLQDTAPTVQLFPWMGLPFDMSDIPASPVAAHDTGSDPQTTTCTPQSMVSSCSQAQGSSSFYSAALARHGGHHPAVACCASSNMETTMDSQTTSMSLAQQMVCEEEARPPSLPRAAAAVCDSMSSVSSVSTASIHGCDSAPSTPVSPDTTSLTPSASFDSLEAWAGQTQQPHMKTCQSQSKTSETHTNGKWQKKYPYSANHLL